MTINRTTFRRGLNVISGLWLDNTALTSSAAEINILTGVTSSAAELNKLTGVTATAAELNRAAAAASLAADGLIRKGVARFTFDTGTVANRTIAAHGTGVTLPANAIVVGGVVDVNTLFTTAGANAGTIAISVEGADDIVAAAACTGAPYSSIGQKAIKPKANTPEAAADIKTTVAREITCTVAGQALTAGKLTGFLEYYVSVASA